jgi:hypothetical protein
MKYFILSVILFFSMVGVSSAQHGRGSVHNNGWAPSYNAFTGGYNLGYNYNPWTGVNTIQYPNGGNFNYRNGYIPNYHYSPYVNFNNYQYNFYGGNNNLYQYFGR